MAEYGLKIKNSSGYVQIDGTYSNMAVSKSGELNFNSANQLVNGVYSLLISVQGVSPSIALVNPSGGAVMVGSSWRSGSNFNFYVYSTTRGIGKYYIFDDVSMANKYNTEYGLVVKNKNTSRVVFDSRCPYMRVIDSISGSNTESLPLTRNYGISEIAIIQSLRIRYDQTVVVGGSPTRPDLIPISASSFVSISGSSVTISNGVIWTYPPSPDNPTISDINQNYHYVILDISGY